MRRVMNTAGCRWIVFALDATGLLLQVTDCSLGVYSTTACS